MTYICLFNGRPKSAIGSFQDWRVKLEAESKEDARAKLYEKYEHVHFLIIQEKV